MQTIEDVDAPTDRAAPVIDERQIQIAMIPRDDAELRRAAVAEYEAIEASMDAIPGTAEYAAAERAEEDTAALVMQTRALTPGGIAYRLKRLLDVMEDDQSVVPWQADMVRAALADALAQERARQVG